MHFKSILTVLSDEKLGDLTMEHAAELTQAHDAHLDVLCLGVDRTQQGYYYGGANAMVMRETLARAQDEAEALAAQVPDGGGWVVNLLDQRVKKPDPRFFSYALSRAGLWWATRTLAQALAPRVRVNGIGPGPTLQGGRQDAGAFARQRASTVLERGADPDDITAALTFLLGAKTVTGQLICVDGGQHLGWQTPDVVGVE